ncbi:MAG: YqgE/AlgH family protein [Alphaproteobacteria bacterium]|nr:YqgE/AlgH family protein [Alphaproteobacteria bacterium]
MGRSIKEDMPSYLDGDLLIAMPQMRDPRFSQSVIYMVAHSDDGAMGIVLNQMIDSITFPDLLKQLGIALEREDQIIAIHCGGPVESGRGFVLHSPDYHQEGTLELNSEICLTATVEILRAIAAGQGPSQCMLALGYAGWGPGQLESEIQSNGWLHAPAEKELVFGDDLSNLWERAVASLGIDPSMLSDDAGHA